MGKSAIPLVLLIFVAAIAVWRLHSDLAIIGTLLIAAVIFFLWLQRVTKFAGDHPDIALLEGAEWSSYKRFQATAKGQVGSPAEEQPTIAPGSQLVPITGDKEPDKEPK